MTDPNALFRKAALDKLSSPERLDVLMTVTSPRGWVALFTLVGLLAALVVWSWYGSIPTRVEGEGMLIRGGSLREIRATSDGVLVDLAIKNQDDVRSGLRVAVIKQYGSDEVVRAAADAYQAAIARYRINQADDQTSIIRNRSQVDTVQADIANTTTDIAKAQAEVDRLQKMLTDGLTTKARVDQAEQRLSSLRNTITALRGQINNLESVNNQISQKGRSEAANVENLRRQLELAQGRKKSDMELISTVEGRVVELKKASGDTVRTNEVIAIVEQTSTVIVPVVYVESTIGKKIQKGMEAQISPSTVKREEFGFLKAIVTDVGDYPVTPEKVVQVVGNADLARELLGRTSKIEVRFELIADGTTPSGFAWSSSGGPPFRIDSGTRLDAAVVVERRRPYTYVLPTIKGALGAS
jgi:HlyD family secretion protein